MKLIPISDIKEMAAAAVKSNLFGLPTPEAALSLMLLCQAEGLHPIQAVRRYHIIKGRPAMRADAMLAEFQRQGGKVQWLERTDRVVFAKFSHESSGTCEFSWTIEQAKDAGLTNNPTWQKYPRQMLTARVISEAVRTMLPGVVCGVYTPEEISDFGAPTKKANKADRPTQNADKVVEPAKAEINAPRATVEPKKTMYQKAKESKPEFDPDDVSDAEVIEPIKAAARPEKAEANSAKAIADQLKEIRNLAIAAGAASQDEIRDLISSTIGRKISSATDMNATERAQALDALKHM